MIIKIIIILLFWFLGFTIGRIGDKYYGNLEKIWIFPVPHHWIWGVIFTVLGILFFNYFFALWLISFGIGVFVSDLNDFLHMRLFGEEPLHVWKFWSIE